MSVISRLTRRKMNYNIIRAQTGTVESVSLIEDRETGRLRGFGFVEMSTKEEGAAAIEKLNGQELGGRALKVNEAKQRENRVGF